MANRKAKVKVRRTWGDLKPVTRVKESKKIYSRLERAAQARRDFWNPEND